MNKFLCTYVEIKTRDCTTTEEFNKVKAGLKSQLKWVHVYTVVFMIGVVSCTGWCIY